MAEREKNIMIVDSGSRGHATADHLRKHSNNIGNIFVVPGNGGTELVEGTTNLKLDLKDNTQIVKAAKDHHIDLVIIAPERPLANGLVDALQEANILTFGPTKMAAKLEWSKSYTMDLLRESDIPHPNYAVFDTPSSAHRFVNRPPNWATNGLVIKADGLHDGKGVIVAQNMPDAHEAIDKIVAAGETSEKIVIQEKLTGFEISAQAITDGQNYLMLLYGEDHKQVSDNDQGDMTGGMGVQVPHSLVTPHLAQKIENQVIKPLIAALSKRKIPFRGILYPALFVSPTGEIKVIEVNARPGGPEWETVLRLLESDLYSVLHAAAQGNLKNQTLKFSKKSALSVVLASQGYPQEYKVGQKISGLDLPFDNEVVIYHAGTKRLPDGSYQTSGGRVLLITSTANSTQEAGQKAYTATNQIYFTGKHFRSDIGKRRKNG